MSDIYRMCECGSGEKYKWCCLVKNRTHAQKAEAEDNIPKSGHNFEECLDNHNGESVRNFLAKSHQMEKFTSLDTITLLVDQLIYHRFTKEAIEIIQSTLPFIRQAKGVFDWTREDIEHQLTLLMSLDHLEHSPNSDMKSLSSEIEKFIPNFESEIISELLQQIKEWQTKTVFLRDFHLESVTPYINDISDELSSQLLSLGFSFIPYAKNLWHEDYARANFAQTEIISYLIDRACGTLSEDPHGGGRAPTQENFSFSDERFFCPDRTTLVRYFEAKVFSLSAPSYHAAAMIMDFIPIWIHFLVDRKLIHQKKAQQTLTQLRGFSEQIYAQCKQHIGPIAFTSGQKSWLA